MTDKTKTLSLILALLLGLLLAGVAQAQEGDGYDLSWWTVDGGGGAMSDVSGSYVLLGSIGQPEASVVPSGDGYVLTGGFWSGGGGARYAIYLPLILRNR